MYVKSLRLRNFRNYSSCEIAFSKGINVLTGMNAQGKTNLLESLVYLSLTRSHRVVNDKKLIQDSCDFARVGCVVIDGNDEKHLDAVISTKGKTLMIRQKPVKRSSEFVGLLNVILFSPDDLMIFTDGPGERRKLINQEITKISEKYLNALSRYQSLLKERNLLLKKNHVDSLYLDTLSEQMSVFELQIIQARKAFLDGIQANLAKYYQFLSRDADARVDIVYRCCMANLVSLETIQSMHKASYTRDVEAHTTTTGIHREDIVFLLNGKNVADTASQGQRRMIVLAFKLALHAYIQTVTNKSAVLLLDDVLSELDQEKQKQLFALIGKDVQCIITATSIPSFIPKEGLTEFTISNGMVSHTGGSQ